MKNDGRCYTECDRQGCHCRTNDTNIINHITLVMSNRSTVCLCGDIQVNCATCAIDKWILVNLFHVIFKAFLPVSLSSNTRISVHHHVVEFSFGQPDLAIDLSYRFSTRYECGSESYLESPTGFNFTLSWWLYSIKRWWHNCKTGSISSPLFGQKEKSTNDGYHHTDCLWIAMVKPTELWTATIYTPDQGTYPGSSN